MKNDKSLGQHWLDSRVILNEIAIYAKRGVDEEFKRSDVDLCYAIPSLNKEGEGIETCLEIGPGLGTLTSSLLREFKKVIAVEYDKRLANNLPNSFPGKNLEVFHEDILAFDFSGIKGDYVVAGNIPYYVTSPIIEKVLTVENKPKRVVLLIQQEVADRIVARKETILSLFVKNRAKVWVGPIINREEFTPPPKVDSRVIIFEPKAKPDVSDEVLKLAKIGFSSPRKKVINNLAIKKPLAELKEIFEKLDIDLSARPGDLTLNDWARLYLVV